MGKKGPPRVDERLRELFEARLKDRKAFGTKRYRQGEHRPESVATLMGTYFRKNPETVKRIEETRALMAWPELVGPVAAKLSQALRVRGRTLIVSVQDALWMQQLMYLKNDLLTKYRRKFPSLRLEDIFFKRA